MPTVKDQYRKWCAEQADMPVFAMDWWLDAACGEENWNVILVEERNTIVASLPYYLKKRGPFTLISPPPLMPTLGPYLTYPSGLDHSDRLSYEKKIMREMIHKLPRADHIRIRCSRMITNWLPFYWAGFSQMTAYSYAIPDISDEKHVLANFGAAKRGDIKKASKVMDVSFDLPPEDFYEHHRQSLKKQGQEIVYSFDVFKRVHDAAVSRNAARIIQARDRDGNLHAALFAVWAKESAYHLLNTIDPVHRASGSVSLLMLEMIRYASKFTNRFDFEGSMIEGVEASYRKFGSVQTPYFILSKTPSRILRLRQAAIDILRANGTPAGALFLFGRRLTPDKAAIDRSRARVEEIGARPE